MEDTLPNGWLSVKLRDIVSPGGNCNPQTSDREEFFYVDIEAIDNTKQKIVSPKRILTREAPSRARMAIRVGDVIFSLVRPYLKNIAIVPAELDGQVASTAYCVMRPEAGILSSYIYYAVLRDSFIDSIITYGNSPPSAHDNDFLGMEIPLAPTDEQRRIVAAIEQQLSRLDDAVTSLQHAKTKLKRERAAILKAAVEGTLTESWRAEHPVTETGTQLLARILQERRAKWEADQLAKMQAQGKTPKDDSWKKAYREPEPPDVEGLPELPEGWCWATVEQVSNSVRYGTSAKTSEDSSGIPVLRMGNIQDGELNLDNLKYLPVNHPGFPALLLQKGDILFNRTNSAELVGKSAVYRGKPEVCSYASYLISVRIINGCLPDYLCYYLNSYYGRIWVKSVVSQQVGQANVNGSKLQALIFPLPPFTEQQQIVSEVEERFSIIMQIEAEIEANLKRAKRMRQTILTEAFAGRLVPQDPNDEPASVLLERIRQERSKRETRKNGKGSNGRYRSVVSEEPVNIDVEGVEQVGLW